MVSAPVQNLSDFLKNRPPLVLFLLCLVVLVASIFYFVFEIQKEEPPVDRRGPVKYKGRLKNDFFLKKLMLVDELLLNVIKKDWTKMLKHFNTLNTCINSSTWTNEIATLENEEHFKDEISVATKVTVKNMDALKSLSEVYGTLSLEGWYSTTCEDPETQPKYVNIFFDIPPLTNPSSEGPIDLCVTIKGPTQFLPFIKEPLCQVPDKSQKNPKLPKGFMEAKSARKTINTNFCSNGTITKIWFDLTEPPIENRLNDYTRTQIYTHLMWFAYFLVFIIFGILLYSIIKKSDYLEKKEESARFL